MLGPENPPVVIRFGPMRDNNRAVADLEERRSIVADDCSQYRTGKFSGAQIVSICQIPNRGPNSGQPILDELLGDPIDTCVSACVAKVSQEPIHREGCAIQGS
jgi:hypothetical protein